MCTASESSLVTSSLLSQSLCNDIHYLTAANTSYLPWLRDVLGGTRL